MQSSCSGTQSRWSENVNIISKVTNTMQLALEMSYWFKQPPTRFDLAGRNIYLCQFTMFEKKNEANFFKITIFLSI